MTTAGALRLVRQLDPSGTGKSFLADRAGVPCVLRFPDGMDSIGQTGENGSTGLEIMTYRTLRGLGIRVPELISFDLSLDYLVREYVQGISGDDLVANGEVHGVVMQRLEEISGICEQKNIRIDFSPGHFIFSSDQLVYLRYALGTHGSSSSFIPHGAALWRISDLSGG